LGQGELLKDARGASYPFAIGQSAMHYATFVPLRARGARALAAQKRSSRLGARIASPDAKHGNHCVTTLERQLRASVTSIGYESCVARSAWRTSTWSSWAVDWQV
jgi:hypothetical protein